MKGIPQGHEGNGRDITNVNHNFTPALGRLEADVVVQIIAEDDFSGRVIFFL